MKTETLYSLEKIHESKNFGERRTGKTVDAIVDVIGKLMVTENSIIPLIVPFMERLPHMTTSFISVCVNHFKETPIVKRKNEWQIKGYSSKIVLFSEIDWKEKGRGYSIEPTYDL